MQLKLYLFGFVIFLTANLLNAQTAFTANSTTEHQLNVIPTTSENGDWTFYLDEQNKVYYIDFETFKVNLNSSSLLDGKPRDIL